MAGSPKRAISRAKEAGERVRRRVPVIDRALRTQQHYSATGGSQQAGAITYFAFLSTFPILALAFFAAGIVARIYPGARDDLVSVIDDVLPHVVGNGPGQLSLHTMQDAAGTVGVIGLVGVLYAGLGWVSSLRTALDAVFEIDRSERLSFLAGKLRDLAMLIVLGLVLGVSVVATSVLQGLSNRVLEAVGLSHGFGWLLTTFTVVVGLAANALLFWTMFVLLAEPRTSPRALWEGAALGGVVFEVLKQLSGLLLHSTRGQPAFQVFGISLILLVWINYFSRVVLYAASFAQVMGARPAPAETPDDAPVPAPSGQ